MIVLAAAAYFFYQRHKDQQEAASRAVIAPRDSIILADLDNKTGDTVFDSMLTQAIAIQLEQSPVLNLVSNPAHAAVHAVPRQKPRRPHHAGSRP